MRMESKDHRIHYLLITSFLLLIMGDVSAETVLETILERAGNVRREGNLPVAVFDLDGTLFRTGFRSKQIFLEYANEQDDSILAHKVKTIDPVTVQYRVRNTLVGSGITDSTVLKSMIDSWRMKFFSDDYLKYDEPIPGSVRFVNALHDSGALIIYLTGRDAPGMLLGTVSSLKQYGFPIGIAKTELIMKSRRYEKTIPYKEQTIAYIEQLGRVIAVFENEPVIMNLFAERFPEAKACFVETEHKPNSPPLTEAAYSLKHYRIDLLLEPEKGLMEETE
jgi:hypothetical protein